MTAPSSIVLRGPARATLKRITSSVPDNASRREDADALAREVYRMCLKAGLNPLAAWAIVIHETRNFTSPAWATGLNPGNIMNADGSDIARFTSGVEAARAFVVHLLVYEQGKAGIFGLYRSLDPGAARIVRAGYAGTVSSIEDFRGKWSASESWPEDVVACYNIVRTMIVTDRETPAPTHSYRFRRSLIGPGALNYSGLHLDAEFFAVHETANESRGADAEMHRVWFHNGGGPERVSFHAVADDREVIQLLDYNVVGWQAGDGYYGPGNRRAESLEICVHPDADWLETLHNAAHYVADRLRARGWGIGHLRPGRHHDFSGKWCPAKLMSGRGGVTWPQFVELVRLYLGGPAGAKAA